MTDSADAAQAAHVALIGARYRELVRLGVIKMRIEPDLEAVSSQFIEHCDDLSEVQKADRLATIERDGLWMIAGYILCPCCQQWRKVAGLGGLSPDDCAYPETVFLIRSELLTAYAVMSMTSMSN